MRGRTKTGLLAAGIAAFLLQLPAAEAQTQDERVRELEQQLHERDKVILELLERVEALERRVGVDRPAAAGREAPETATKQGEKALARTERAGAAPDENAPGRVVVEKAEAERALERSLTRAGALLLSEGILEIEPGLSYARTEDSSPRLSQANDRFFITDRGRNTDSLSADAALRLGLPWDAQLEIGLPYRWRNLETKAYVDFAPTGSTSLSGSGFGDVRLGLAKTLLREGLWRPDLIGRITWDTGSGESLDNEVPLGGGFDELRGSLTAIKRQDPIVLVGRLSYEYVFEDERIKPGSILAADIGSFIALSPESSLSFSFLGAYQDESEFSGEALAGSDRMLAGFTIGGSTLLAPGLLMNLSVEFGLTEDADDFAISLSFPFRFSTPLY